jgi:predicted ATPase
MTEEIRATIKFYNYRCYSDRSPGILEIRPGFTAFVGTNNSGKSTLLRAIRELKGVFGAIGDQNVLMQLLRGDPWQVAFTDVEDPDEIFNDRNEGPVIIEIEFPADADDDFTWIKLSCNRSNKWWAGSAAIGPQKVTPTQAEFRTQGPSFTNLQGGRQPFSMRKAQGLSALLTTSVYIPAFRHAISGASGVTGGDLMLGAEFLTTWASWQTGATKWQRQRILRIVEDVCRIFDLDSLVVQPALGNTTLQLLVNGRDYRLREMGAGITQFLLVLATAAIRRPGLVFIDEPELNLHPTLQQDFLTSIASYCTYGVMFATHSIGLARTAADHLNAVRSDGNASSVHPWEANTSIAELLGELSYSAYREIGQSSILGVEGLHDVRPVQQFLRLLNLEHSTLVIPLGGDHIFSEAGIETLQELKRLATDVFVLLDSERTELNGASKDRRGWFAEQAKTLGIKVHLTERRAIENYFSTRAIQLAISADSKALGPYESHSAAMWRKHDNWRIAREMTLADLASTDVGVFMSSLRGTGG